MPKSYSAALPVADVVLRILIVLNCLSAIPIGALLIATIVDEQWTLRALGISPESWIAASMMGLRAVALLGLVAIPLYHMIFRRLLGIIRTVSAGDPFVAANAERLQAIAWVLLVLQLLGIVIGIIGKAISTPENPVHLNAGFSTTGWLAVLLTFVLAGIFAEGARMRDDLEGTV